MKISYHVGHYSRVLDGNIHWVRFGSLVISLANTRKMFSERQGYVKSLHVGFGWRLRFSNDSLKWLK